MNKDKIEELHRLESFRVYCDSMDNAVKSLIGNLIGHCDRSFMTDVREDLLESKDRIITKIQQQKEIVENKIKEL